MPNNPKPQPVKPDLKWHPSKKPVPVKSDRGEFGFK